ncbi:DoxX family protein [Candidatus Woesearchaeota archaeon]|nr:DoxX family protein [Candidatus Woesearchaeota archaeon]
MFLKHQIHHLREQLEDFLYCLFRIFIGFLFFSHGAQKLFGWFGAQNPQPLFSLMGVAGIVEVITGILIFIGLWTRIAAFFAAGEMVIAYLMVHASQGINPLVNKGELALLFFAAFLVLIVYSSGKWSLQQLFPK